MKSVAPSFAALISASVLSGALLVPVANAELSASAGVANMYLWRGIDLGDGSPAVFGDLSYSTGGAYIGIWASSGDSSLGQEYDLYAGYGGEIGQFSYDLSVVNYNYSDAGLRGDLNTRDDTTGELTEVILTLGFGPITAQYHDNVAGNTGYEYWTLAGTYGQFTLLAGYHDQADNELDMTHVDLSYAYNDRLTFTVSKVVDHDKDGGYDDDMLFVISYNLPLDL
ncbi:MAG: TorF family putative porin [Spongiibacteraceae bacterium]|jgi:hypothetical protein|nr:TorF family putative porin [Spongiibacteraceae bacterium]